MEVVCSNSGTKQQYKCYCDLTDTLDTMMGIEEKRSKFFSHYIELDWSSLQSRVLALRLPGSTVGFVRLHKSSNKIEEIELGISSLVTYPDSVKEKARKFVGEFLEFGKVPVIVK